MRHAGFTSHRPRRVQRAANPCCSSATPDGRLELPGPPDPVGAGAGHAERAWLEPVRLCFCRKRFPAFLCLYVHGVGTGPGSGRLPKRPGGVRGALVCCLLSACGNPRAYGTCGVSILSWVGRAGRMDGGRQDRVREIHLCAKRTRHRHLYHRGGHRRGDCASPDRLFQSQVRMAIRLSCGQCCRAALGPLLALCYRKPLPAFAASGPKRELELQ